MVTDQVGGTPLHPMLWGKKGSLTGSSEPRGVKAQEIHEKTHYLKTRGEKEDVKYQSQANVRSPWADYPFLLHFQSGGNDICPPPLCN